MAIGKKKAQAVKKHPISGSRRKISVNLKKVSLALRKPSSKNQPDKNDSAEAHRLSKSRYCLGIQCLKALYLKVHHPELAPEIDLSQQLIFDQGSEVGVLAQRAYPGGVLIDFDYLQTEQALKATENAIAKNPRALFEAALQYQNTLVRIDVLKNNGDGTWDIVEVKSTTKVREAHLPDLAIQRYVAEGSGLKIRKTFLKHINNQCVFPNLNDLFTDADCTEDLQPFLAEVPLALKRMQKALAGKAAPTVAIGPQCDAPYECAFKTQCWDNIPEHSVFELHGVTAEKKFELYERGTILIKDIPMGARISRSKAQQLEAVRQNAPVLSKEGIRTFLEGLSYPIYFFDFETINPAIPIYPGQRPYIQLPFQFSCHVLETSDGDLVHHEYLADGKDDPRTETATELLKALGTSGTILAFNDAFERTRIRELAEHLPALADKLSNLLPRFIDLKKAFAHYYHPDFHGSLSIKDVLPVLVPSMSYADMEVNSGSGAQAVFTRLCRDALSDEVREKLRQDRLAYCKQDTLAMVELLRRLRELTRK